MYFLQYIPRKTVQFIGLALLMTTLILYPSFSNLSAQTLNNNPLIIAQKTTEQKPENQARSSEKDKKQENGKSKEQENKLEPIKMIMGFLAGLVLFLYGVTRLADGLRELGGDRTKEIIRKFTGNPNFQ